MATYKLIQDIEAEDHILGPLTLRQFVFALLTAFLLYLCFIVISKGAPFLLILFLPPALLSGFFAFPFGRDQPTEIWALGKLRFWFKPRRRIWNQSGLKDLVTITVPKKIEHVYTDGLSQTEVKSRLQALANTIDSRGWAIKNVDTASYVPTGLAVHSSDRLLDVGAVLQTAPDDDGVPPSEDILDTYNNPIARQFDSMINQSTQAHHRELVQEMNDPGRAAAANTTPWFMPATTAPAQAEPSASPPLPTAPTADEAALTAQLRARSDAPTAAYGNLRTIQPLGSQPTAQPAAAPAVPPTDPALLALASNDDLNVATIAREAQKSQDGGEVTISLR